MPQPFSRRRFAAVAGTALAAASGLVPSGFAAEPFKREGKARLRLSLAGYSFRQYFKDGSRSEKNAAPVEKRIDLFQFIDYCADHGCQGAELTSYYFPENFTKDFLLKIKRHAFLRGVELSGTAVGNTFTVPDGEKRNNEIASVKKWIDHAAVLGIPHIRVFAGDLQGQSPEVAKKNCIRALEECCEYAGSRGIFLGIENHGGIVAESAPLLDIIHAVQSPWVGINLDTGNFRTADPYADVARCAPYAVNVQVKTEIHGKNGKAEPADLKRLVKILQDANYQGYVVLEYEAAEDPYKAVPRALNDLAAAFEGF
jgi:sugar phosphate isomerase/epimerase